MKGLKIQQSITDRQDTSLGIFFKEVSKIPMADINEEIELCHRIQNGDESALNRLVEANLRFVISVAKQYQNKGLPLVDLIQEGVFGLIESAKRWDESRGFKFISYAVWWIRQSITQAISSDCRTVRIPMNQVVYMSKISKATSEFEQENERTPSVEELEQKTGITQDNIIINYVSTSKAISLDAPFNDEGADNLLDVIPDSDDTIINENITKSAISEEVEKILNELPFRNSDIIRMYFGIGMYPMTLEEIGTRFGLVSERVRQILHETLERLKKTYKDKLKEFL